MAFLREKGAVMSIMLSAGGIWLAGWLAAA
jgi:hypothetical protein